MEELEINPRPSALSLNSFITVSLDIRKVRSAQSGTMGNGNRTHCLFSQRVKGDKESSIFKEMSSLLSGAVINTRTQTHGGFRTVYSIFRLQSIPK